MDRLLEYKIPQARRAVYSHLAALAVDELPLLYVKRTGIRNGEGLFHDEAELQKRLLSFRLARYCKPPVIIESHPGVGLGSLIYKHACPTATITTLTDDFRHDPLQQALVDIDPFGCPWTFIDRHRVILREASIVQITSGEVYAVVRNWTRAQWKPTENFGTLAPRWIVKELIPDIERSIGKKCVFFYGFPTSARLILSSRPLPRRLWRGCEKWLSWFSSHSDSADD
jgi:hypothetical protein